MHSETKVLGLDGLMEMSFSGESSVLGLVNATKSGNLNSQLEELRPSVIPPAIIVNFKAVQRFTLCLNLKVLIVSHSKPLSASMLEAGYVRPNSEFGLVH